MTTVLVTGATGNVGSGVVRALQERGAGVRAFVRDPVRAAERLGGDVELALGDFSEPQSLRDAMQGLDRVFLASADGTDKVEHEHNVIDVAAGAGIGRIVKASTILAEAGSPLPGFDWNGQIEDHLRASGVPAVVLQSSFYMTNLLMSAGQVRAQSAIFAPAGDGKVAMVDPRDVGAVAAAVLTEDGHEGRTYVVTGPEVIGYHQVAEELTAATGRPVSFVDVPDEAARQAMVEAGLPDWVIAHLTHLFPLLRQGALDMRTDTVRELTGLEPRTFGEFARDRAGLFA